MSRERINHLLTRPRSIATRATRLHAVVLRLSRGRVRRSRMLAGGQPVLVLTTTGRKSGQRRSTVVACMPDGDDLVVVPSNAGHDRPPAWWLNLQADPQAEVEFEGRRRVVRARRASREEEERFWPRLLDQYRGFTKYRGMTQREIPVVVLERGPASGSHQARES